jgi:hypothetical protein
MARQPIVISARTTISHAPAEWVPAPQASGRTRTRLRAAIAELPPDTIEAIAQRVAELLEEARVPRAAGSPLVDAGALARQLGLTRAWVYEHAKELGAIRLGDGPRARLRFNPELAAEALAGNGAPPAVPKLPESSTARRPRPRRPSSGTPLLPIRGRDPLGGGVGRADSSRPRPVGDSPSE